MRRSDVTLTIALCLSLALHALICVGAAERYARSTRVWLPAFPGAPTMAALYIDEPVVMPTPEEIHMRMGDTDGQGTAVDASPGDVEMIARQSFQDQPFLSRDPIGPGKVGDDPTDSTIVPGSGSAPETPAAAPRPTVTPAFGLKVEQAEIQTPYVPAPPKESTSPRDEGGHEPVDPNAQVNADELSPAVPQSAVASTPPPLSQSPGEQPGPRTAADPAPKADSEIDPTSASQTVAQMDLRRGSTVARAGRKHRIIRPKLNLAAKADLTAIRTGNLVLKIRLDDQGNVKHVAVLKSSGSEALDQVCKVVAYEWWFEPLKDAGGKTIGEEFQFVIVF